jgi:hypothetical protein
MNESKTLGTGNITVKELSRLLDSYLKIMTKVRGREVAEYSIIFYGDEQGRVVADLKPPKIHNKLGFVHFVMNNIPDKAYLDFSGAEELELVLTGKKTNLDFYFDDEI